ncbi:ribose-5-phosphate isomerase RpiA [Lacticaseibacillus rhamnosus]|uniref:ribose-5-phosphate isomerase RpiA n=1 Tax=Lacticaseibacillus rhamnosus TaxID=47715 RepID=UPI0007E1963E|nr:ribose-5-phosphate isomerase RpiA [Lacticaseibacillus rhamnosus]MBB1164854.1 ribose-5-phosphate isomerase RpiA [Lacticaseibacillus rhamnosus]MCZ2731791.1 ribose-5-phosphate isomerase RpiA [Lacticaseibacillus rhamnosus]MCZ2734388.1 ribose-5-phosphate isomerase RpiA [Lacticaseibacillus rhamnosus]MCZ2740512.1 ribose-5-phosphate isomerase RpiA [Lacticaseibacillus rhamnosus]MCZ2743550.1 ribose-5-phosphate isomerase RpiA [Lacticaseibacillus rhamnosus]
MNQDGLKKQAAEKAAEFVQDNMTIGLGTGSTVYYLVEAIAKRIQREHLKLTGVATSMRTHRQAESLGIHMVDLDSAGPIDLTIDGADEIDTNFQGIKGGGAAHLIEKIVAINSARNIWIVDSSKLVKTLGAFPLPIEVIPFGSARLVKSLAFEGLNPKFRLGEDGKRALTDSKNFIVDLHMEKISHPHLLASWLNKQVGIVEHGLFLDLVNTVVVGTENGTKVLDAHRG